MAAERPATPTSVGLDDLTPIARRLNNASDELNLALRRIEHRLNELGIGIDRFEPIPGTRDVVSSRDSRDPEEWSEYQVGYDRIGDRWALLIRRAHFVDEAPDVASEDCWTFDEIKPLLKASRELRIKAVAAIPALLKALKAEAEEVLSVVDAAKRLAGESGGRTILFEFGETVAARAFWDRNPEFLPSFVRLVNLINRVFGREWRPTNRLEDVAFNLGESCRRDFLEVTFLAINGYGLAAQKLLRGLYERAATLEYIRRHPEKAERFVRFGIVQEYKVFKAAAEAVGDDLFAPMRPQFTEYQAKYDEVRPEFKVTDCRKCKTTRDAYSWDLDLASIVRELGQPYQQFYLAAYALPNLHVHATATSAFARDVEVVDPDVRDVDAAESALIHATLILILVLNTESDVFSLDIDSETKACWDEVTIVWKDRPHRPTKRL
jgi:hypothetical protein